jgi:RNA polymerase primary sigma factor
LPDPFSTDGDDLISEVVESLLGDHERTGRLLSKDIARITTRRELEPEQINAVIRCLAGSGIMIEDESDASPDTYDSISQPGDRLLTQEEQVSLTRVMHVGLRLRGECEAGRLQRSEDINQLILEAEQARERLISCNRRLVKWVVNDFRHSKVDAEDLIQEGTTGLMRAVEKFDPDLGIRFSTYAVWWIRQAVHRSIDNDGELIRIPVHRLEQIRKLRRTEKLLQFELGRAPRADRLAAALDWELEFTVFIQELSRMSSVALDSPLFEDHKLPLQDIIADDRNLSPEESTILLDLQRTVEGALQDLEPREQEIIRMRFGVGYERDHTLEEIGQRFSLTRERIRQIEEKALRKMHKQPHSRALRTFRK